MAQSTGTKMKRYPASSNRAGPSEVSFVAASGIGVTALALSLAEGLGLVAIVHPLFWLPILVGAVGVAVTAHLTRSK